MAYKRLQHTVVLEQQDEHDRSNLPDADLLADEAFITHKLPSAASSLASKGRLHLTEVSTSHANCGVTGTEPNCGSPKIPDDNEGSPSSSAMDTAEDHVVGSMLGAACQYASKGFLGSPSTTCRDNAGRMLLSEQLLAGHAEENMTSHHSRDIVRSDLDMNIPAQDIEESDIERLPSRTSHTATASKGRLHSLSGSDSTSLTCGIRAVVADAQQFDKTRIRSLDAQVQHTMDNRALHLRSLIQHAAQLSQHLRKGFKDQGKARHQVQPATEANKVMRNEGNRGLMYAHTSAKGGPQSGSEAHVRRMTGDVDIISERTQPANDILLDAAEDNHMGSFRWKCSAADCLTQTSKKRTDRLPVVKSYATAFGGA
jgi:hypothetical protein